MIITGRLTENCRSTKVSRFRIAIKRVTGEWECKCSCYGFTLDVLSFWEKISYLKKITNDFAKMTPLFFCADQIFHFISLLRKNVILREDISDEISSFLYLLHLLLLFSNKLLNSIDSWDFSGINQIFKLYITILYAKFIGDLISRVNYMNLILKRV